MWFVLFSFMIPGIIGSHDIQMQCETHACVQEFIQAADADPLIYRVRVWPFNRAFASWHGRTVPPLMDRQKL